MLRQKRGVLWVTSRRKRLVDLVMCALLSPAALGIFIISLLVLLCVDRQWKALYSQSRLGRYGRSFRLYKLRTMPIEHGNRSNIGELLCVLGADETPQILYNIWRGDMAVIGPRPLMPRDFELMRSKLDTAQYHEWYTAYTACRPGWMGAFSQPSRKYIAQSDEYLRARYTYDTWYYHNASLTHDICILFRSFTMWCTDMPRLMDSLRHCMATDK